MQWTLEVVVVPVADVERAKAFYAERLGFRVDHDTRIGDERLVQLTPPGSGCSIALGTVQPTGEPATMAPGSLEGLQVVVGDLRTARAQLVERGVEVGDLLVYDAGALRPARDEDALDNVGFLFFEDPDGNRWTVQQIAGR